MITFILISSITCVILAPLGCLVLWRKYAYFTDGFAHASTLAATIALAQNLPILYAWIFVSFIFVLLVKYMQKYSDYNAAIALITSLFLAISSILSQNKVNLGSILFGKIQEVNLLNFKELLIILIINILFFAFFYKKILIITLSKEIAFSLGIKTNFIEILFLMLLALSIVFAAKIVGSFFVINLILIPALISKIISRSPLFMLLNSIIISLIPNLILLILYYLLQNVAEQYLIEKFSANLIIINISIYLLVIFYNKLKKSIQTNVKK
ncbi:MAG: metal ABC transporter permease [Rickettsia sp.]|nr:metal ABC transporter permease [Rickettsia sp.]